MKLYLLKIPEDLHTRLKAMAAVRETTMRDIMISAIDRVLCEDSMDNDVIGDSQDLQ
ncbi:MAG: hypothetical protein KJN62_00420 [Deltaproteobacteria bacterium]|nr:hypothetical protein [Deltaproteobacteria bacterium]